MPKWAASDPRWKAIAEGRWPPHNPGQRRLSGKTTRAPGLGPGRFQSRQDHLRDGRRARAYAKHGLTALQRALQRGGTIDPETPVGRALTTWRSELIADLGGAETVTTQQVAVVDVAVRTKLLLDSVDAWLLAQPTLVHHKTRSLLPVVIQRQRLADGLVHYMHLLGLERRAPKALDLAHALAARPRDGDEGGTDDR